MKATPPAESAALKKPRRKRSRSRTGRTAEERKAGAANGASAQAELPFPDAGQEAPHAAADEAPSPGKAAPAEEPDSEADD